MGKSVKSGHYQKIIQKGLQIEGLPRMTFLQKSRRWRGDIFTEMVADGRASKHNIFTERGQGGIGCPLTQVAT